LNPVVTHSLKAPGFNPCPAPAPAPANLNYKVISWFSKFAFM
jgi:hypothetical protein